MPRQHQQTDLGSIIDPDGHIARLSHTSDCGLCPVHGKHGLHGHRNLTANDASGHGRKLDCPEAGDALLPGRQYSFRSAAGWPIASAARTVFRSAIGVFMLRSILCGVSNTLAEFVATRFLQGIGGVSMPE